MLNNEMFMEKNFLSDIIICVKKHFEACMRKAVRKLNVFLVFEEQRREKCFQRELER